ncbi:glycosyltransferase family 4 protein [Candidatus Peregrinibacteria bacterium]|nr:glycosyltransferase family 4 protein [Candidatus Peregrinibacteria bacterium]
MSFDYDPPRGGLGRAIKEMVNVLQEKGMNILVRQTWCRIPFFLQHWIRENNIRTLMLPVGPGGLFLFRRPKNVRLIVICYHTYWQQCRLVPGEQWKRLFVPFEHRTLRMADQIFCYCRDTERVLKEEYGLKNVKLMRQILDIEQLRESPFVDPLPFIPSRREGYPRRGRENILCLYIGRKDRRKGFHVLMEAWKKVKKNIPHAELCCVTQGDMSDHELRSLMSTADLIVVPSYLEGFGLVAAQAMCAGKTVLGCDSDGLRSLIGHGETGWLVPPGNAKALHDAWVMLLKHNILRERLGLGASIFMHEKFNRSIAENELVVECGTQ